MREGFRPVAGPGARVLLLSAIGLLAAAACAPSRRPASPTETAPLESPSETPPIPAASPLEEPLAPGELRCGLDDGPVPIGLGADDLRGRAVAFGELRAGPIDGEARALFGLRVAGDSAPPPMVAAKPRIRVDWKLGEGITATDAFRQRARTCAGAGQSDDGGAHGFSIRFASRGQPMTVRVDDPVRGRGPLTRCFAAALCSTAAPVAEGPHRLTARLAVEVLPPTFTGTVQFHVLDERPLAPTPRPFRHRRSPPRVPYSTAEMSYIGDLHERLGKETIACAKLTPPANALTISVELPLDPKTGKLSATLAGRSGNDLERKLSLCFGQSAAERLRTPPKGLVPRGSLTVFAFLSPSPPSAEPEDP